MNDNIIRLRTARNILHRLEDDGIINNNLSMDQITAIRLAEFAIDELCNKPLDIQPMKHWHKYPDDIPPYDGDYLCYHRGFCNVYEYFHEKWFSESGEEVKQIDKDGLYWQDLPTYPDATKAEHI